MFNAHSDCLSNTSEEDEDRHSIDGDVDDLRCSERGRDDRVVQHLESIRMSVTADGRRRGNRESLRFVARRLRFYSSF